MREVAFIKRNKHKWVAFEDAIQRKDNINPDELSDLYIRLLNDLSFARTYYPKSKTTLYLNELAAQAYHQIYNTPVRTNNLLVHFYKHEVPEIVMKYKGVMRLTFAVFFITVGLGVLSAIYDDGFVRLILGDEYVNMTLDNIAMGDPVAVYKSGSDWGSFIGITFNNLYVGLKCFVWGITGGLGTLYIILQNGVMLGAFQTFFAQHGVFWESVRGIWIHGSMEIFAIVIEATAGLILGMGILFPGSYSRLVSFKISMKAALKLWLSTVPFTVAAGFLEGFVTRFAGVMPDILSVFIIITTLGFISWYYLIFPFKKKL